MPAASIKFTQGLLDPPAGEALIGVLAQVVTASNGDNSDAGRWEWEWRATPAGSVILPGIVASGLTPTITFTPDVTGTYVLLLRVYNRFGAVAEDERCFSVLEIPSGRLIPNFEASGASMNFNGQPFGWAPYLEAWLKAIDAAGSELTIQEEGVEVGTYATMNFTGPGVTATDAGGGVVEIEVPVGPAELLAAIDVAEDYADALFPVDLTSDVSGVLPRANQVDDGPKLLPLMGGVMTAGSSTRKLVGSLSLDLSLYPTTIGGLTRKVRLVADVQKTSGATNVEIVLYDVPHNVDVTGADLTSTSNANTKVISGVLSEGTTAGKLRTDVETLYELHLLMTGGTLGVDQVTVSGAALRLTYE